MSINNDHQVVFSEGMTLNEIQEVKKVLFFD